MGVCASVCLGDAKGPQGSFLGILGGAAARGRIRIHVNLVKNKKNKKTEVLMAEKRSMTG